MNPIKALNKRTKDKIMHKKIISLCFWGTIAWASHQSCVSPKSLHVAQILGTMAGASQPSSAVNSRETFRSLFLQEADTFLKITLGQNYQSKAYKITPDRVYNFYYAIRGKFAAVSLENLPTCVDHVLIVLLGADYMTTTHKISPQFFLDFDFYFNQKKKNVVNLLKNMGPITAAEVVELCISASRAETLKLKSAHPDAIVTALTESLSTNGATPAAASAAAGAHAGASSTSIAAAAASSIGAAAAAKK